MLKLRDYQKKSQVILSRDTSGLDGSDLGTGKTLTGVERVRAIADDLDRPLRVVVVGPTNTQGQWKRLFEEQFPSLKGSPILRIVGTPGNDPEGWKRMTSKGPGIFIIGWESMRGVCPKRITVIKAEAAERIAQARADRIELKKILRRKSTPDDQRAVAVARVLECDEEIKIRPGETAVTKSVPREGWVPKDPGGASRGYGTLYKNGTTLTKAAVKAAMKAGDVPPWHRTGTWDLVIADESHRMSRRSSINKLTLTQITSTHRLAMSATFAGNRPEGAWSTLNWLWPKEYSSFSKWSETFMLFEDVYTGGGSPKRRIVGEKFPGETWVNIPCKVRHLARDVRGELPDVIERIVDVNMTAEQAEIYWDFADQSLAWIDDHPVGEQLPLTQRIRLRQAALGHLKVLSDDPRIEIGFNATATQPKIDMIKDILLDLPDGERVMIYTHAAKWVQMATEVLTKTYPGQVRAWTGATKASEREAIKESWRTGKDVPGCEGVRIVVAQLQAIAEGTDGLQYHCACEIWASQSDDGLVNTQAKGRLHRDGQTRPVQRWLLQTPDTIDVDLDASLRLRRAQMKQFYRDRTPTRKESA